MLVERASPFCGIVMCASKAFGKVMSLTTVYQTNCRFCESIEVRTMLSFAFITDFFAVAHVATKASNVAMAGDYEEAKRIIETL